MPSITFDRFDGGLDLRKGASVQEANRLLDAKNVYITPGWRPRKRPGLLPPVILEAGTVGLVPYQGKLHTFYENPSASVAHVNSLFVPHLLRSPTTNILALSKIHSAIVFNGFLYVVAEFVTGQVFHFYLDTDPTWTATTVLALGAFRQPAVPIGLRYEVTTAGTTGASQPAFPLVPGATVVDGTVTWTCRSKNILDVNCPNHRSIEKIQSKIYSPGTEVVRFCATNNARNWTLANDAGFLPTGINASGDPTVHAVSRYRERLAVVMIDAIQLWTVDPDPLLHALTDVLAIGTDRYRSFQALQGDTYFLAPFGFRSIADIEISQSVEDLDVGSPIDPLVKVDDAAGNLLADVQAVLYSTLGQYLLFARRIDGTTRAYVFSKSRISKLNAWSYYDFSIVITDVAELGIDLYVRSQNSVYRLTRTANNDNGVAFQTKTKTPFLSFKKPGQMKQLMGIDVVQEGRSNFSVLLNVSNALQVTPMVELVGDTRPDGLIPVDASSTEPGFEFTTQHSEEWQLEQFTVYYDIEGVVT